MFSCGRHFSGELVSTSMARSILPSTPCSGTASPSTHTPSLALRQTCCSGSDSGAGSGSARSAAGRGVGNGKGMKATQTFATPMPQYA